MPFINGGHIWLIAILLVIVLIIWGPGKLPDVGAGLGRAIREFRKASSDTRDEFVRATRPDQPSDPAAAAPTAAPAPAPVAAPQPAPVAPAPVAAEPSPVGASPARPVEPAAGEGDTTAAS